MTSNPTARVTVHALSSGFLTLPTKIFVHPSEENARLTVPSLSFLIQHFNDGDEIPVRVVFDLGLRRTAIDYPPPIQEHLKNREPFTTRPDVGESLQSGGFSHSDIDFVALSHVHYDHVGTPSDFKTSIFLVGHGSRVLLRGEGGKGSGSHSYFESDLLPESRTLELPRVGESWQADTVNAAVASKLNPDGLKYVQFGPFDAIDIFGTSLVYLVNAPGHLQGHQNMLVKVSATKWVYLAGDAAHDRRLLRGTHSVSTWQDAMGHECSMHHDLKKFEATLEQIRNVEKDGFMGCEVEVVLAHDVEWFEESANKERFWPGKM